MGTTENEKLETLAELLSRLSIYPKLNPVIVAQILEDDDCNKIIHSLMQLIWAKHKSIVREMVMDEYAMVRAQTCESEFDNQGNIKFINAISKESSDAEVEEFINPVQSAIKRTYGIELDDNNISNVLFRFRDLLRDGYDEEYAWAIIMGQRKEY